MVNEERNKKLEKIACQIGFVETLFKTVKDEIEHDAENQNKDPWNDYDFIKNHYQHANDVRYIRRQMLKLQKMLEGNP